MSGNAEGIARRSRHPEKFGNFLMRPAKIEIHGKAHAHEFDPIEHRQALKQRTSPYQQEKQVEGRNVRTSRSAHRHIYSESRIPVVEKSLCPVKCIVDMIIERRYLLRHIIVIYCIAAKRINTLYRQDNAVYYERYRRREQVCPSAFIAIFHIFHKYPHPLCRLVQAGFIYR